MKEKLTVSQAKGIIADFHGLKIEISNNSKIFNHSIKRIIPMIDFKDRKTVNDVEILLNKKYNYYFSIGLFLKNQSWVKRASLGEVNLSTRKMKAIHPFPITDEQWIKTARFINLFLKAINRRK